MKEIHNGVITIILAIVLTFVIYAVNRYMEVLAVQKAKCADVCFPYDWEFLPKSNQCACGEEKIVN